VRPLTNDIVRSIYCAEGGGAATKRRRSFGLMTAYLWAHQEEVGTVKKSYVKPELRKVGLLRDVTKLTYSVCELK